MANGALVYRQTIWTRLTHWIWAVCLLFLLMSGLMIFNAHPSLYIGHQSGFGFDNAVLDIGAEQGPDGPRGYTTVFGHKFDTTGFLGYANGTARAFPSQVTVPSYYSLGTGRVIHFFFAWILVPTLLIWFVAALLTRHAGMLVPRGRDLRGLPKDIADHARLRLHHTRHYNVLQKLSYAGVLFVLLPLMILTGLTMSPGFDAVFLPLLSIFGGRQTARTIHFICMNLLVIFVVIHILMVLLAGPLNELRSMITGWYRIDKEVE